ncbi:MAG: phosphatidate cytidylyltransferase [Gammaproteobacteria bacterium]
MLRLRVLTALVLVPLVVWGVIALPELWFALVLAAALAVGAWEWARLIGFARPWARAAYVVFILACMALAGISLTLEEWALPVLLGLVVLWWLLALRLVARYRGDEAPAAMRAMPAAMVGMVVLVAPWAALVSLGHVALPGSPHLGRYLVLFLLLLMWVADSGAFFAGRRWGRHKLAPRVSPGKTWEGVWGALAGAAVLAVLAGPVFEMTPRYLALFVILCLVTVAFSVLGDLIESLFKRQAGLKDSSHLLPGHGGMLDRIDSLTAAAPVFMLGLLALGLP